MDGIVAAFEYVLPGLIACVVLGFAATAGSNHLSAEVGLIFPVPPSKKDSLQLYAHRLKDRNFAAWYLILYASVMGPSCRWMFWPNPLMYMMAHIPGAVTGIACYIAWRRDQISSQTAGRSFTASLCCSMILAATCGGPHALHILSQIYSVPTMLLAALVLQSGMLFVMFEGLIFCATITVYALGYHTDVYVCVECILQDAQFIPIGVAFFNIGMYVHNKYDQQLLLQRTIQFRDELLASVSHEFKTPLHGIVGALDLLKESKSPAEQAGLIGTLSHCSAVLQILVRNNLTHARAHGDCTLEELVMSQSMVTARTIMMETSSILPVLNPKATVSVFIDDNVPLDLSLPHQSMSQILLNLTSNAIKYGGLLPVVDLSMRMDTPQSCEIMVSDRGPGVPEAFRPHLFEPYSRGTAHADGTGLGLSICRKLATELRGSAGYTPRIGGGSTFWVRIPLLATISPPVARLEAPMIPRGNHTDVELGQHQHVSVILCEDNLVNSTIMRKMIFRLHPELRVDMVTNGAECLEALMLRKRTSEEDEQITCLIDLNMPLLGGNDCCALFRQYEKLLSNPRAHVAVRFVSVTAAGVDAINMKLYNSILLKPVKMAALAAVLDNM